MQVTMVADRGDDGVRIDRVLQRHLCHLPGVTRNRLQRLIEQGAVTVNGRPVSRPAARVAQHDAVAVDLPERRPRAAPAPEDLPLDVRYEDDGLLIVNKPPGQVSHPAFRHASGTLLNALVGYARGAWTPALVSRLDKGTSGLVLVAKSRDMHVALQRLASDNAIDKTYLAVVSGKPPARGTIDLALDRDPWDHRRVTVRDRGGVPSVTQFVRLRLCALAPGEHAALLRCRLITGRMHQIRVHLAAKGWPIVGDAAYGVPAARLQRRVPGLADLSFDRQALHAWRLHLTHPVSGERLEATATPPADMTRLMSLLGLGEAA